MARNQVCTGIVLRTYRIAEIHMGVTLFTDSAGLVSAIAHGAHSQKGKLRALTNPFCHGTIYLYSDPVSKSTKITDADIQDYFMGIRESVRRFYTASLWGEIVLKSYGGGEGSSALFDLFLSSLRKLDTTPDPMVPLVSVQFLARFLLIAGTFPDTEECGSCGRAFGRKGLDTFYSSTGETLLCAECAGPDMLRLPPGVLSYLNHTLKLPVEESYRIQADSKTMSSLQTLMYSLVGSLVEVPLRTLEIGRGIL